MNKRMSTATAVILITVLLAVGCNNDTLQVGSDTLPKTKTELTFYYPIDVGGPVTATLEGMTEQFMKEHPDIRVKPIYMGSYNDTTIKTQASLLGNNPPDVAVLPSTQLFTLLDMNAIVPLDLFIAKEGGITYLSDFYEPFLVNSQTGGHTYSIPFQRSTVLLYYNIDAFREAGLDPSKPPESWDDLIRIAKRLTTDKQWGLEIPSSGSTNSTWMFQMLALQNGGMLMSPDGKRVFFDTPENAGALEYWLRLSRELHVMPVHPLHWAALPADFLSGKAAMMYYTSGNLTNMRKTASFPFHVAFPPKSRRFATPTGGGNFYIFKGTSEERQEASWTFVRWMTEPKRVAQWSIDTGYVAVRKSAYDTDKMKSYTEQYPDALVARDQLIYADEELSTHNNDKVLGVLEEAIQAALSGRQSPKEVLKQAQTKADKALEPFQ
ncbi:ABC transporter substrate-binding protein [Paenibacillus sp. UNC451MF]|uniref:ABC transporter substrate-binding protein n=1 Tax=Paenibacillus sp. UNC451MF TaxID=1449063 RepID=UPI000490EBBF|nr:ABC transporter substrate-binding protein [Paenibacillus sp. UNC451MF]